MAKGDLVPAGNRLPEFIRMLQQQSGSSLVPTPHPAIPGMNPELGAGGRVNIGPSTYSNPALPMGSIPQPVASSKPQLGAGAIPMGPAAARPQFTPQNGALFADPRNIDLSSLRDPNPRYVAPRGNLSSGTYLSDGNGGLGARLNTAPITPPKVTPSGPSYNTFGSLADSAPAPTSAAAPTSTATPAAAASSAGRFGGLGQYLKQGLGGAVVGYGASIGTGMAANAVRPQNPGLADVFQAGSITAPIGGMVGVPMASALPGLGASGVKAMAAGTTAPIVGAAAAEGFTASDFGNDVVNAARTRGENLDGSSPVDWLKAGLAGSMGATSLLAPFVTGGTETEDSFLDVAQKGLGGDGGAGADQPKLAPQDILNNAWNMTGMEQPLRDSMQVVYDLRVQSGEKPEEVAAEMLDDIIGEYQMRQTQQQELSQLAAQQEQAVKHMRPYVDNIRAQGLAQSEALKGLLPMLPPQFQAYGQMAIQGATQRANQLADSYLAQASLAPSQAVQQRHQQAQQAYESQLAQQIQQIEIQNQLAQMQASGQAPVPLADSSGI